MDKSSITIDPFDRRGSLRIIIDDYYTVEFLTEDRDCIYEFKIKDASKKGVCFLVEKNSNLLNKIKVGDVLHMKYYPTQSRAPVRPAVVKIAHISESPELENAVMVGLMVIEDQSNGSLLKSIEKKS